MVNGRLIENRVGAKALSLSILTTKIADATFAVFALFNLPRANAKHSTNVFVYGGEVKKLCITMG